MITASNYFTQVKPLLSSFNEALNAGHGVLVSLKDEGLDISEKTGEADIDDVVELQLQEVNKLVKQLNASKPKIEAKKPRKEDSASKLRHITMLEYKALIPGLPTINLDDYLFEDTHPIALLDRKSSQWEESVIDLIKAVKAGKTKGNGWSLAKEAKPEAKKPKTSDSIAKEVSKPIISKLAYDGDSSDVMVTFRTTEKTYKLEKDRFGYFVTIGSTLGLKVYFENEIDERKIFDFLESNRNPEAKRPTTKAKYKVGQMVNYTTPRSGTRQVEIKKAIVPPKGSALEHENRVYNIYIPSIGKSAMNIAESSLKPITEKKPTPTKATPKVSLEVEGVDFKEGQTIYLGDSMDGDKAIIKKIDKAAEIVTLKEPNSNTAKSESNIDFRLFKTLVKSGEITTKKPSKATQAYLDAEKTRTFADDLVVIKYFTNIIGKKLTAQSILNRIKRINKLNAEKRLDKTLPYYDTVKTINEKLVKLYKIAEGNADGRVNVKVSDTDLVERANALKRGIVKIKSVTLYQEYISKMGRKFTRLQLNAFAQKIDNAIARKVVTSTDPFYTELKQISASLKAHNPKDAIEPISILSGLGCACTSRYFGISVPKKKDDLLTNDVLNLTEPVYQTIDKTSLGNVQTNIEQPIEQMAPTANGLFTSMAQKPKMVSPYNLAGTIGDFFGTLDKTKLAISIMAEQGAGKTPFAFQIANSAANAGLSVLIVSLEIAKDGLAFDNYKKLNIAQSNWSKISVYDEQPTDIEFLMQHGGNFDVVILDSYTKLSPQPKPADYDALRTKLGKTGTLLVSIVQTRSDGELRGGNAPQYDCDIECWGYKGATPKESYFECKKNRYGETGLRYYWVQQKLTDEAGNEVKEVSR